MRGLHWFRQDLRLRDNAALAALADVVEEWLPVFVLDPVLLSADRARPRDRFLLRNVEALREVLAERDVPLLVRAGRPETELPRLMKALGASRLSFARSETPYARSRDERVRVGVEAIGGEVLAIRDQTVFGAEEIRTKADGFFSVFTPYRNAWWRAWNDTPRLPAARLRLPPAPIRKRIASEVGLLEEALLSGAEIDLPTAGEDAARRRLRAFLRNAAGRYATDRDVPAEDGTARLSAYLRFGVLSARQCFGAALSHQEANPEDREGVGKWLDELVWREFYASVLARQPRVLAESFRPEYDRIAWSEDEVAWQAWCTGRTGFPIVDAGMRQLLATGWMHNRVRMIVASFLTKDLLIDWRRGAEFFMAHLVDGDPASNNGGWQWAASTGTDPQPYFRIFNPTRQGERWDPTGRYVKRWIPELADVDVKHVHEPWRATTPPEGYPAPVVDHAQARERALSVYKAARQG